MKESLIETNLEEQLEDHIDPDTDDDSISNTSREYQKKKKQKQKRKLTQQEKDIVKIIRTDSMQQEKARKSSPSKRNTVSDKNIARWSDILEEIRVATNKAQQ